MSTNLYLNCIHPTKIDTLAPIEHQWESSPLTADGNFPIHAFRRVFPDVQLVTDEGTVGEWIGTSMKPRHIQFVLLQGIRTVNETIGDEDEATLHRLLALSDLLVRALELHLQGHLICIRWC